MADMLRRHRDPLLQQSAPYPSVYRIVLLWIGLPSLTFLQIFGRYFDSDGLVAERLRWRRQISEASVRSRGEASNLTKMEPFAQFPLAPIGRH